MKILVRFWVFYSAFSLFSQFGLMAQSTQIVKLKWVNFGPYTQVGQDPDNRSIVPESQIISLLDSLKPYAEGIRTFGSCDGLEKVPYLAKQLGFKVIVGIWLNANSVTNAAQIASGIQIAQEGYADKLMVGCEALLNKTLSATKIIEYIDEVKKACPNIPVSYADTPPMLLANPEVMDACDFVSSNIYPFWEGYPVECAMQGFHQSFLSLSNVAKGKEIFIAECGWKTSGPDKLAAKPSLSNAIRYNRELLSWSKAFGIEVNLFEAYDEPWKEKHTDNGWGLFNSDASLKTGMESIFEPIEKIDSTWQCKKLDNGSADTITFDFVPPIGSFLDLKGHINFLKPCEYRIATWIKVGENWWPKPYNDQLTVPITCNGHFTVDVTTGGIDELASEIKVFVVPANDHNTDHAISTKLVKKCPLPYEPINVNPAIICIGNSSLLTLPGITTCLWDNGATTPSITVKPEKEGDNFYYAMVTGASGCIETRTAKVLVQPKISYNKEYKSICTGESYKGRTTSCEFTDTLSSVSGCDSIVVTKLSVHHSIKDTIPVLISPKSTSQNYFYLEHDIRDSKYSISGYRIDVASDSGFVNFVKCNDVVYKDYDAGIQAAIYVCGLNSNTTYYCRIREYNACDTTRYSHPVTITTYVDPPLSPVANPATNNLQTSFTANWDTSTDATSYVINVLNSQTYIPVQGFWDKDVGNVTSIDITGLNANTPYQYYLRSYNKFGFSYNTSNTVYASTLSNPPIANAGSDQYVGDGALVTLNGSLSSGADGKLLTYQWTAPSGISLSSTTIVNPKFTVPNVSKDTSFIFTLVVNDGTLNSMPDQVTIRVSHYSCIPAKAHAGPDETVKEGTFIELPRIYMTIPELCPATHRWIVPSEFLLSSHDQSTLTYLVPQVNEDTKFNIIQILNFGLLKSEIDTAVYTVINLNNLPVANAGPDRSVCAGATVTLDGSLSSDPQSITLTYKWTVPQGITLNSATDAKPIFSAPTVSVKTDYPFSLVVNNGSVDSRADSVIVTVNPLPAAAGTITGSATVLQGQDSVIYTVPTIANATSYLWTLPTGATGSSTTNSITVSYGTTAVSGNITVKGHNDCGDGTVSTLAITINPSTPGGVHFDRPFGFYENPMNLYVIQAYLNGVALAPGDEIAAFDGPFCCGSVKLADSISISDFTSFALIAAFQKEFVGSPYGFTPGKPITYKFWDASKCEEISGISAEYIDPYTSQTTTAPNYTVDASAFVLLSFTTQNNLKPDAAGAITGSATVCQGQGSVVYTVPTIANATSYIWTFPEGVADTSTTNSITVDYGASAVSGNITVKGHNDYGDGVSSTLGITVNPLPKAAVHIIGPTLVCQGQSCVLYTVSTIVNATSYVWTLPTGATGTSTTNSITVNYGVSAVSGNVTVKGHNDCGDGVVSTLAITVNPSTPEGRHFSPPFWPDVISNCMTLNVIQADLNGVALAPGDEIAAFDGLILCGVVKLADSVSISDFNSFVLIRATAKDVGLSNGFTPGNPITYKFWDSSKREEISGISAEYIDPYTSQTTTALNYTVDASAFVMLSFTSQNNPTLDPAGTITGSVTVCQGQDSVVYTVPTIANATSYIWTFPEGATGTSTTNSIAVDYGISAVSGSITVKGHNDCGDGVSSTLAVTVNPLPASAGTIIGPINVSPGQSAVVYTVPTIANATSYVWTLPTGATGESATNSITVDYGASAVSGNITVKGHNACGDGLADTLAVIINSCSSYHFASIWTGNGFDQMNINVYSAKIDGVELEACDEIGIFDGTLCVGTGILTTGLSGSSVLTIITSRNDGSGNGYTPGNAITYKLFDRSQNLEISNVGAAYSDALETWSTDGKFAANETAFVALTGINIFKHDIHMIAGWNIISTYVVPANVNLKDIFQPHIDSGKLKKVMDEAGKTVENFGIFGGWKNNIGNLLPTEGYKVNVKTDTTISLEGTLVPLPLNIPLTAGWNIISYPCTTLQDGKALVQSLIDAGKIIKVMDESGKTIENFGIFGGWKNNIGNFVTGKGYKVNAASACTLSVSANATKAAAYVPEVLASVHFIKVFDGNGTDHMNVSLIDLQTSGLRAGDEIGVFDGKYCVGSATIGIEQLKSGSISIPASANEGSGSTVNGFTIGNAVGLQLYRGNQSYPLETETLSGAKSFEKNGSVFIKVSYNGLPVVQTDNGPDQFRCYPNPFKDELTIEIRTSEETGIDVAIYNLLGQKIKTLYKGTNKGELMMKWNGTNDSGHKVAQGVYLCKMNGQAVKVVYKH